MKLYDLVDAEELLSTEIVIDGHFPAIYIDEYDTVYCYNGLINDERFIFMPNVVWYKDKRQHEVNGFFRIKDGRIVFEKEVFGGRKVKCKRIDAYLHFPMPSDMSYHIISNLGEEIEEKLTRAIFGLTYDELNELLNCFNEIFKICPINIYSRYPRITRSSKNNHCCDISNLWIPREFPYITFNTSNYYYSTVSLYGFYQNINFLTQRSMDSYISNLFIKVGLNPSILESVFKIKIDGYREFPVYESLVMEIF